MAAKEAHARIKINSLLEEADWRFFDDANGKANIQLEPNIKITQTDIDAFGRILKPSKTVSLIFFCWMKKVFHF